MDAVLICAENWGQTENLHYAYKHMNFAQCTYTYVYICGSRKNINFILCFRY